MNIRNIAIIITLFSLSACATKSANSSSSLSGPKMTIENSSPLIKMDDTSPVFSGNVDVTMLFDTHSPSQLTGALVAFKNNARSAWHSHPLGQLLVVTEVTGLVQQWGEKARIIKAGQVVWTPPGVKHWHGACADKEVSHYALQEKNAKGKNVIWMEKVSDQQYNDAVKSVL